MSFERRHAEPRDRAHSQYGPSELIDGLHGLVGILVHLQEITEEVSALVSDRLLVFLDWRAQEGFLHRESSCDTKLIFQRHWCWPERSGRRYAITGVVLRIDARRISLGLCRIHPDCCDCRGENCTRCELHDASSQNAD